MNNLICHNFNIDDIVRRYSLGINRFEANFNKPISIQMSDGDYVTVYFKSKAIFAGIVKKVNSYSLILEFPNDLLGINYAQKQNQKNINSILQTTRR